MSVRLAFTLLFIKKVCQVFTTIGVGTCQSLAEFYEH